MVDGKLAEDILFAGSQVPMSDAQGNRMIGTIKEVGEETVKWTSTIRWPARPSISR